MNMNTITDLYRHMHWADAAVWTATMASDTGQTDSKLRDYFYHLHVVQRAFLRLWRGEPGDVPYPTFSEARPLMGWGRSYYDEIFDYLSTLSEERVGEEMPIAWAKLIEERIGRAPAKSTIGETVLQVVMHSQYHRGQINTRLRQIGAEPPLVDYIAWVWIGRPEAEWPQEAEHA